MDREKWTDYRQLLTLEDKVRQGLAESIHQLPPLFREGDIYEMINFIDHVVDIETEKVVTWGTPLIRRTLGYMDEALYHLCRAVYCTEEIATVEHGLGVYPAGCSLYAGEYAYGVGGYGDGPYGGTVPSPNIPVRLQPISRNTVKLFSTPKYAGSPEVSRVTAKEFSLFYPDSLTSLILVLS